MIVCVCLYVVFFFKQKTAYEMRISDWSSDVCSSDLEPNAERRLGHYSEGIPSIEPLQSRFHAAASKRIGAVLKSSLMLSTAARRAASIAFHRTARGKATRRQLTYQRKSKGKAMTIEARRRMEDWLIPTGKMVFLIK